jgi:L-arabinose isomerase
MAETAKANVGLLGLIAEDYDCMFPGLRATLSEFGRELADTLAPFAEVDYRGACNTREQVERTVADYEATGKDLLLVVLLAYAPSHVALRALRGTRLPIVIFNTQRLKAVTPDILSWDTTMNHGMVPVLELASVLRRAGCRFRIVTGHYRDEDVLNELKGWCDAARVARGIAGVRIGLLGYPAEGMGDIFVDENAFLGQLGVEIHHVAMKAVADLAGSAPDVEIMRQMAEDRQRFEFEAGIAEAEHDANARLEWAMRQVLRRQGLHGLTYNFGAIEREGLLDTLPFLAASKLLAEGYGFGGEGDVACATAVCLMQALVGQANFVEMFTMDFEGNATLLMHMGECNWKMARKDEPVRVVRNRLALGSLRYNPLLLGFTMEPGDVTLVSLTTNDVGRLRLVVGEGELVDFRYVADLARPHSKFKPDGNLREFLTRFGMEGGTHHQAMAYGRWASTVEKVAALLNIEYARV